ncbi:butyrophilin-like protein 9 [Stegastes partitus]|uniref:Butyrophilin-like protein 9 n=1 Tax=Stegastes partitus TaxID=144197 RepID=A0A9Y4NTW3_9TELE|nr:PREDICTED: butyrophilin-like protein 9 [Stegastes partitus]
MKFLLLLWFLSVCLRITAPEEPEVIGSHVPVTALVGQDVILQCQLEPPFDVHNLTVEWRFHKTIAHMYRSRGDDFDSQHERFRNRTVLFHDNMVTGDISLKLINVTEEDKGNYTCHVPNLQSQVRKAYITLNVVSKEENERRKDPDKSGAIAGIIVAVGVVGLVIAAIVVKRKRGRRRQQQQNNVDPPAEMMNMLQPASTP